MEKENNIMEQPPVALSQGSDEQINETRVDKDSGSILGKFREQEDLKKAYESLQKEFTKKCQLLSDTQKKLDNQSVNTHNAKEEFLAQNTSATRYIDELETLIKDDKQISESENPYLSAWNKFRQDNFVSKEDLSCDEEFIDKFILTNENIKKKVIDNYFESINMQTVPPMIARQVGSKSVLTSPTKPSTFAEAGAVVKSLLEK